MDHRSSFSLFRGSSRFLCAYTVVLGILWTVISVQCLEYRRVSRKLLSSPEPEISQFSHEDLRQLLSILEKSSKEVTTSKNDATTERASAMQHNAMIFPELMRIRSEQSERTTTTTEANPMTRTTRRFYRRLRRKPTTAGTTTETPPSTTLKPASEVESSRMLPTGSSPGDILQQISLLNGILGALNSSAQAPTTTSPLTSTVNANDNSNATPVPDFLALFTGAKPTGEASSKSAVVVPPPHPPSPSAGQGEDPTAALALLNLFSNGASTSSGNTAESGNNNAAANLLNLVAQSQQAAVQPSVSSSSSLTGSDADATAAALTKLLLQGAGSTAPAMQSNSIVQSQTQNSADASAAQLNSLLGLLGTLGAASQQTQPGNINQLFNLGGDQVAQAQTTNSLSQLFGQQTQQQQGQAQNLLNLLGGNQGNQAFGISSLLAPQTGNSIPGLGLLSTMSSLGSSIFSTVSNIFGGGRDGKPRVRGKGVDTRVGLGYRLGNIGDAQVVWDIGPQLFTDPLRNEMRPYTQKRESGSPSGSHYFQSASATATEKEVQQIEAKRRMVQAAIQDHYRGDHFASVYPKPSQRRSSHYYDTDSHYNGHNSHYNSHYYAHPTPPPSTPKSSSGSSSLFTSLPFGDHLKGFWTGLTSGISESDNQKSSTKRSHYYNFDDVRSDFSTNLIKRSSPDYTGYESRALHPEKRSDDIDDPTHSTLTEYERMLLQYGKDVGVVASTQHGVIEDEPQASESGFLSRWFKGSLPSSKPHVESNQHTEAWDLQPKSVGHGQKSVKKTFQQPSPSPSVASAPTLSSPYGYDGSFNRRNIRPLRRKGPRPPQKRRSHNPFRNWIASFRQQSPQRPRNSHQPGGFRRRNFKRPSVSANPKLQHFSNTNQDLMMADANDDFVEPRGKSSSPYDHGYEQPSIYNYPGNGYSDVSLTMPVPPRRQRPTADAPTRASLSHSEHVVEPALLYDHLQVSDSEPKYTEVDESFSQRNKVVVNPVLREREKQKVLGTLPSTPKAPGLDTTLTKIQKLRLQNKLRINSTASPGKQKIIVRIKGNKGANAQPQLNKIPMVGSKEILHESTTPLPSVLSTISSIFSGTSKPKLLNSLIQNVTSIFPSISSIRILPRKKKKGEQAKTKLTLQNGKPAVVAIPQIEDDEDDQETAADGEGEESPPVVQVGHDMSFPELQSLFGSKSNGTKRRRFRIRVKESVLKGEIDEKNEKERKDSDEDDEDGEEMKDIFVDIESGEVSVLKPVASLVSFDPKNQEASDEEEVDYYEDDDGDGVADADMKRKEHIFEAIQKELVKNFEKMKRKQQKAEAKKRRKQELVNKGMDESMDVVTKYFDLMKHEHDLSRSDKDDSSHSDKPTPAVGGLSM